MHQASYVLSFMKHRINRLSLSALIDANDRSMQLRDVVQRIREGFPEKVPDPTLSTFPDACFNISSNKSYGITGIVNGFMIDTNSVSGGMFH